jgi:hypothetical protein
LVVCDRGHRRPHLRTVARKRRGQGLPSPNGPNPAFDDGDDESFVADHAKGTIVINNSLTGLAAGRTDTSRFQRRRDAAILTVLSTLLLALTALGSVFLTPAEAAAEGFILRSNEQLRSGQRLVSSDGQYVLVMQGDGNLVEYAPGNRPIWASGTNARDSVVRMQSDGNVVIIAPGNRPVWATGTNGNSGATLELQTDANLVVYAQGHAPRWASGSTQSGTTLGDRIVSVARGELINTSRNKEQGGYNCNFYTRDLLKRNVCEAWCADFARWVWRQAGANTAELDAGAVSFVRYGDDTHNRTWRPYNSASAARVGDAAVFNYRSGSASHVGLVTRVNKAAGTITIIEGNAGDNDNQVSQRTFVPSAGGVTGFTSPVS